MKYKHLDEQVAKLVFSSGLKCIGDLTVDLIASKLSINVSYLSRKFKKDTGILLSEFINEEKLRLACHLLMTRNELRIVDVSEMIGICKCEQFRKKFKKRYRLSPGKFRELYQKKKIGVIKAHRF
ncbi:MAG TPA: helix-turn-helix transcriptional regulator [Candidatus Kapabacteria bacterium]|nr:helix-turn-helix transcriptional regulator [Candidatus Kapabacteria bacterium]